MIQAGEMNMVQAIAQLELRVGTLEKVFDFVMNNNYGLTKPTQQQIEEFRNQTVSEIQNRYPSLGLKRNP